MASDVLPAASEKAAVVQNMFDRIAPEYDRMNGLMTAGFDRAWRRAVIAEAARTGGAFRFLRPAFSDPALVEGAMKILGRVGIEGRADTPVSDLAHGERRLLELALALAGDPALLLLDEPMAGAGPEETQHMIGIIDRLRGDVGILLIEHDMDAVFRLADRMTVLVEGAVIASGTPEEIAGDAAVRAAYLGEED